MTRLSDSRMPSINTATDSCPSKRAISSRRRTRRRPTSAAAATLLVCVALCDQAIAFAPSTRSGHVSSSSSHTSLNLVAPFASVFHASTRMAKPNNKKITSRKPREPLEPVQVKTHMPLLTREEEKELLRQAVELRRLTNLERELAVQMPQQSQLLSVRARHAGYGDELDEYQDALEAGHAARETLISRNMGLVHHCVQQIVGKRTSHLTSRMADLTRDDMVQEGAIGLARAVDKWNPEFGGKFSSYAYYWVRAAVLRCIAERDDLLRVPTHVTNAIRQVNRAADSLGIDLTMFSSSGGSPLWQEAETAKKLAEAAGLTDRQYDEAMKVRTRRSTGGYVAFESWMQTLAVTTPEEEVNSVDSTIQTEHLRMTLSQFLGPKEMEALSWRYGLMDEDAASPAKKPVQKAVVTKETVEEELQLAGVDIDFLAKSNAIDYIGQAESELFGTLASKPKPVKVRKPKKAKAPAKDLSKGGRWGEAMTFREVGDKMQVSAEYGRRLCHAALKKLQQAAEAGELEPALLV